MNITEAAKYGQLDKVKQCIEEGVDVDTREPSSGQRPIFGYLGPGWTALMYAVYYRYPYLVKYLLDVGADPNLKTLRGTPPLRLATYVGDTEISELLLDAGAHINDRAEAGWSALTYARSNGYDEMVDLLLKRGADLTNEPLLGKKDLDLTPIWSWTKRKSLVSLRNRLLNLD